MHISIISALDENNAIGNEQKLLCYLPADLKRFKELTTGHTIVMGRRTFESLPKGALPNRLNIVLSRNKSLEIPGAIVVGTMQEAIEKSPEGSKIFIIGGASVYNEALAFANTMDLTIIHHKFEKADTFFPKWSDDEWQIEAREDHVADEKNGFDYSFVTFRRKK